MAQVLVAALKNPVPLTTLDISDNFEGRTGKFIKGFLFNDKRNKNGWMVPWEVLKKYASDFINHPGIYNLDGGEPDHSDGETYRDNMRNQEDYRVVNIVSLIPDEATHTINYVGEIIDDSFAADYEAGKINMTSPAIWPVEADEVGTMPSGTPMLDVMIYRALHVAYINEPAYGDDAFTIATCDGDGEACKIRLSAKTNGCGLCANDNLAPLMEVPLIRRTLKNNYTTEEIEGFHAEFTAIALGADYTDNFTPLDKEIAAKLKIVVEDNPNMEKDQQLAIAYAYCKEKIAESLLKTDY